MSKLLAFLGINPSEALKVATDKPEDTKKDKK
jgi:hypothetical protein